MKRFTAIAAVLALCAALCGCSDVAASPAQPSSGSTAPSSGSAGQSSSASQTQPAGPNKPLDKEAVEKAAMDTFKGKKVDFSKGIHHAVMVIEDVGTLEIEIYSDRAPKTAREFCRLVLKNYYDKTSLYWILNDMYALIGDAAEKTKGDHVIAGEYGEAGYDNTLSLKRGTMAMSRGDDGGTTSDASSLILVLSDLSYLDGKYAAFAKVTDGMEYIDEICARVNNGNKKTGIEVGKDGKIESKKDYPKIKSVRMVD